MTFLYPLGLLGLIGVPILILIYILKNKYTEQVISSTYLWTLSERFLKRRIPIRRLTGIVSLILQLIAVVCISLAISRPILTLPNAANDYCFILDGSGSMNMSQKGSTRFELGKKEISSIIKKSADGSAYTIIFAGNKTDIIFEGVDDKEFALTSLKNLTPDFSDKGFAEALETAQKYFNENPAVKTYLVTDKSYAESRNVNLINVGDASLENYALTDVKTVLKENKINVSGNAVSHKSDAILTVNVYVDGAEEPSSSAEVRVTVTDKTSFNIELGISDYNYLKVAIADTDCLAADNEITLYNVNKENSQKALLISEKPFFMQAVLLAVGFTQVEVVSPVEYIGKSGYDLYIFNSYDPSELPTDGAVWFFNPAKSVPNSGFTVQNYGVESNVARQLHYTNNTMQVVKDRLLKNVKKDPVIVKKYTKCGLNSNFIKLLSTAEDDKGDPVMFTGMNKFNNREVVFACDLQDTDFVLKMDFITLSKNLLDFTFPSVVEKTLYDCGEVIDLNVLSNCRSIRIETPNGKTDQADTTSVVSEYELSEAGLYEITVAMADNSITVYHIFATLPESESNPSVAEEKIEISGEPAKGHRNGRFDRLWILFLIIGVLCAADWVVYCYDQYQLR